MDNVTVTTTNFPHVFFAYKLFSLPDYSDLIPSKKWDRSVMYV